MKRLPVTMQPPFLRRYRFCVQNGRNIFPARLYQSFRRKIAALIIITADKTRTLLLLCKRRFPVHIDSRNIPDRLYLLISADINDPAYPHGPEHLNILFLQFHTFICVADNRPTKDEEELYIAISDYLQTDKLYALPDGQRTLITMVLRKLLASSSFAIAGTLESLISRLRGLLAVVESELNLDDYDSFDELADENSDDGEDTLTDDLKRDHVGIQRELEQLERFLELAQSINANSKGDNLLSALEQGFQKMEELGGQQKAVIFTESRRTQSYLFNLLSNHGYEGQMVFLNGLNNDEGSKCI